MRHLAALALAIAVAGCGGSEPSTGASFNTEGDARYTEQEIAAAADLTSDDGLAWSHPSGCRVAVILNTAAEVELYAGAGDPVVTNPAGDAGVKFHPDPGCREALLTALERLP